MAKVVEVPPLQFIGRFVDVPVIMPVIMPLMQRQVPQIQPVAKTVEVPAVPFIGRIVDMHVLKLLMQRQVSHFPGASKTVAIPPAQFVIVGMPMPHFAAKFPEVVETTPQERTWCIFEDACFDTTSLSQPDGVAGALAWLTSKPARVDQPPARHTWHGFRLRWAHEASAQRQ